MHCSISKISVKVTVKLIYYTVITVHKLELF